MKKRDRIVVIGACGRVGLPFCLIAAEAGFDVIGIDKNHRMIQQLYNTGIMPYVEEGAQPLLDEHLGNSFQLYPELLGVNVDNVKVVVVMIGTPIDEYNNPRLDDIFTVFDEIAASKLSKDALIILRSTVAPGTTDTLIKKTGLKVVFAPERVAQGKSITETISIPQLIGCSNLVVYAEADDFFKKLGCQAGTIFLSEKEAEFSKLVTNMYRYVNFAFANEIYMLACRENVDPHKIINAANKDYPRMNMPLPGPNVGGPCLYKDGQFLVSQEPFVDMIQMAFRINESMPAFVYALMQKEAYETLTVVRRVMILGVSFKAENDDTRNSLAFKFMKILKKNNIEFDYIDPYLDIEKWDAFGPGQYQDYDTFVVFTPHKQCIEKLESIIEEHDGPLIVDPWKIVKPSTHSKSGVYLV
jgi:UDP-N-acetyl-D-mannosaminuronic acid dehydrogenase